MELIVLTFAWELRNFESHMPRMYFKDEVYPVPVTGNKISHKTSILGNGFPFNSNESASTVSATQIPRPQINGMQIFMDAKNKRLVES
jgi:hypothetical protein